jgi:hypothetical protein
LNSKNESQLVENRQPPKINLKEKRVGLFVLCLCVFFGVLTRTRPKSQHHSTQLQKKNLPQTQKVC